MINKKTVAIIRFLNPTLLLAPIIPLVYSNGFLGNDSYGYEVYFKSFLIIIPLMLFSYLSNKCKHFIMYLITGILVFLAMLGLMILLGPVMTKEIKMIGLPIIFGIEMFAIFIHHLRARLIYAQQLEEEGRITKGVVLNSVFTTPNIYSMFGFAAYYYIAMGLKSRIVCNEVFFSAIAYIFMYIICEFISGTERYLGIHHNVAGIPKKRVYGIGLGMVGIFMTILFVAIVPSIILMNNRPYYDLTKVLNVEQKHESEIEVEEQILQKENLDMEAMLPPEDSFEWPEWVKLLSKLFIAAIMGAALFFLLRSLIRLLGTFKNSFNENDDIIENLEDEKEDEIQFTGINVKGLDSQTKKIRRKYKRTILKARKERPQPFESPTEMEAKAGLLTDEAMIELHKEYEKARYGE